ncbi:MAG: helix-turn-helix transcriptional regulator [Clostridia bacterium]|jgi:transcriptional regulator with XRE-family HTH domain|nr:helix-turn-helix transcriptional regulator [Clostridia bacterium]
MKILRELRKEKNLTIAKTAEFLNMPFETYRSYEAGKNQADYETLVKLADFFGVTVDYLLGRESIITNDDRAKGWVDSDMVRVAPIEAEMLEVFREVGLKRGKEVQKTLITVAKNLCN